MSGPSVILSADIATLTGCSEWEPGIVAPRFYSVRFGNPGTPHAEAFTRARRWLDDRLSVGDVAALYAEATMRFGAAFGQTNADTIKRLVGLSAIFAAAAGAFRVKYREVEVQTIRIAFLGNGHLKGQEAKPRAMEMARMIGWSPNNLDEADAAALQYFAITREHPKLAPPISPMLHHQVATAAENAKILREQEKRERGLRRLRA